MIEYSQTVPISLQRCWEFFSSPRNLGLLTPSYLGFTENAGDIPMYEGQIIIHTLRPIWGVRIKWVTEITHVKSLEYFVDEQRIGPYKFWHHEHRFRELSGGTKILDKVHYLLPYGVVGKAIKSRLRTNCTQFLHIAKPKLLRSSATPFEWAFISTKISRRVHFSFDGSHLFDPEFMMPFRDYMIVMISDDRGSWSLHSLSLSSAKARFLS